MSLTFADVSMPDKILTSKNTNPHIRRAEYAVRGELAIRSEELKNVRPIFMLEKCILCHPPSAISAGKMEEDYIICIYRKLESQSFFFFFFLFLLFISLFSFS